jgi:hypothetical protein
VLQGSAQDNCFVLAKSFCEETPLPHLSSCLLFSPPLCNLQENEKIHLSSSHLLFSFFSPLATTTSNLQEDKKISHRNVSQSFARWQPQKQSLQHSAITLFILDKTCWITWS